MKTGFWRVLFAALLLFSAGGMVRADVVYHRGNDSNPETLDQHKTSTVSEANILADLYEGLLVYDAAARVSPGMAQSWDISKDGTVYTFHLRDAKWSNGDAVTAGDFVYSLRRIMDPATGAKYANILYPIKNAEAVNKGKARPADLGVKAIDDSTLEITLEGPTPYFLELLTHQTGLPVHPASVEKYGSDFVRPENMVTNGAYTLTQFTPDDKVVLDKSPTYHDAANVKIDRVIYYPMEDRSACVRRFEAGEIDSCSDLPTDQMASLREKFGDQVRTPPYLGTYYYAIRTDKAPFSDVRVRRALSMSIDRVYLAEEIWADTMLPAYSFVPPGISNYGEPAYAAFKDEPMLDREDEAAALLKEAGFGPGHPLKVEISYNTSENHKNTAVAIADMWKAIGVETSLINRDGASHYAYLRDKGDFDVARAAWIADYSDPQNFLFMVRSDNPGFNYANYANPDYDALMNKAAVEQDLEKRAGILHEAETMFMRDVPFIPLMFYSSHSLVSQKLKGWEDNVQNKHLTRYMAKEN
ncbi:oligopeptide transport system substrate-binding protein [Breoghania corrubedonensis]|uniref:Oligopeptide transport system substrate-binding protein n=1 Tax=Breoghania corrubedonensis TaxID=665038 RepID=A0A2T5VE63_9HYPH|nr:oligopeptide transport system substrate-binding protein [Breoghania corrubedonensis]